MTDYGDVVFSVYRERIRDNLDFILNGSHLFQNRREIVDVSKLTDDEIKELWKCLRDDPSPTICP